MLYIFYKLKTTTVYKICSFNPSNKLTCNSCRFFEHFWSVLLSDIKRLNMLRNCFLKRLHCVKVSKYGPEITPHLDTFHEVLFFLNALLFIVLSQFTCHFNQNRWKVVYSYHFPRAFHFILVNFPSPLRVIKVIGYSEPKNNIDHTWSHVLGIKHLEKRCPYLTNKDCHLIYRQRVNICFVMFDYLLLQFQN